MNLRSVAVLGGGPGGLYVARLLKLSRPGCSVDVYEQSPPEQTFGFGVGLATKTQRNLAAADPASLADIVAASHAHDMAMAVGETKVRLPASNLIAIGRSTLLDILRRHAEEAGVRVHYGARVSATELNADLVVAADGVSSPTREAGAFGSHVSTHRGLYLWCGTDFALPSAVFRPVTTEFGTFVAHAYPYRSDRSTFLVETDEDTWRRAGFDVSTEQTPPEASDEQSLSYLAKAFHDELQGHPLIGNRTRWLRFRTVTCERWHDGNVVLLGDAVHTAHYSIGSGTKLAMEAGIALVRALDEAEDLETALRRFTEERRPAVEHLQATAHRSMLWWDSFPGRLDLPVEQLLVSYMTRAGKVTLDRFAGLAPEVVRTGLAQFAGCTPADVPDENRVEWILNSRATDTSDRVPVHVTFTDAWGPEANALVAQVRAAAQLADTERTDTEQAGAGRDGVEWGGLVADGVAPVVLTAADEREAVLTLFDVGERLRREAASVVIARVDRRWAEFAAAALASARVDLVDLIG